MARSPTFVETEACKRGDHAACAGYVPGRDINCGCPCHRDLGQVRFHDLANGGFNAGGPPPGELFTSIANLEHAFCSQFAQLRWLIVELLLAGDAEPRRDIVCRRLGQLDAQEQIGRRSTAWLLWLCQIDEAEHGPDLLEKASADVRTWYDQGYNQKHPLAPQNKTEGDRG